VKTFFPQKTSQLLCLGNLHERTVIFFAPIFPASIIFCIPFTLFHVAAPEKPYNFLKVVYLRGVNVILNAFYMDFEFCRFWIRDVPERGCGR